MLYEVIHSFPTRRSSDLELINDLEDGHITTYTNGSFTDLCRGPHIISTVPIKAIKLLSIAGAYWRGHESFRCFL